MTPMIRLSVFVLAALSLACSSATTTGVETPSKATTKAPWGPPNLTSNLQIDAGKEFLFGGGMNGAYTIEATNVASIPLRIAFESPDGSRADIITLPPGQTVVHAFADGQIAIVVNTSPTSNAAAKLRIWGNKSVGMGYRDAK